MTPPLVFSEDLLLELPELVEQCVNGTATDEQIARLDRLLIEDEQAPKLYARYVHTLCGLRTWSEYSPEELLGNEPASAPPFSSEELPHAGPLPLASSPVLGFLGSAYHGVTGYIGDHEWAQGVLGGTVFLALLFAVLGSIEIFSRWRLANRPQPQDNQVVDVPAVRAAQLTGVYDCRWTGSFHPPRNEVLNVDDYINLASGLAEVTYDSARKSSFKAPAPTRSNPRPAATSRSAA